MDNVTTWQPPARWTLDVNGKQDFDGQLLSISCRYYPPWKNTDGRPSAFASILFRHGDPGESEYESDYTTWREAPEFKADTEAEIKVAVERWVAEQMRDLAALLGVPGRP